MAEYWSTDWLFSIFVEAIFLFPAARNHSQTSNILQYILPKDIARVHSETIRTEIIARVKSWEV